jgi:hypothetical protein
MAETIKILGQSIPQGGTLSNVYAAPNPAVLSTIMCCNQNAFEVKLRISVAVAGAVDTPSQYLYYDVPLGANDSIALTVGITMAATDVLRAYSDRGGVSFNAFGMEVA